MNKLICLLAILLIMGCGLACAQSVDFWRPMIHPEAMLDTLPAHAVHFSTYDRGGGNSDMGHYYGTDRGWNILADLRGPGVIGEMWFTGKNFTSACRLRIFVDDTVTALIDTPIVKFFGQVSPFVPPLADSSMAGWYCYVPIPYQSMARVTYSGVAIYNHVNALSYPAGTTISRFTMPPSTDYLARLDSLSQRWLNPNAPAWPSRPFSSISNAANVQPSQSAELLNYSGSGGCRTLYLRIPNHTQAVLENVWVRVFTDHYLKADFEGPLSAVFGLAQGWHPYRSVYNGAVGDSLYLNLPIPFRSHFRVTVENRTGTEQNVTVIAQIADLMGLDSPTLKPVGIYREENPNQAWAGFEMASLDGPGTFLGASLDMQVSNSQCYEGDENIWVDGEATPSWKGTGTEDYFNAAYYWNNGLSCLAYGFHGCVNWWWQWAAAYRWQVTNPVPFHSHFRMAIDVGPWNNLSGHYRGMAFFAVQRNPWQVVDADGNGWSFPAESLHVIGQSLIPGSRLRYVTLDGNILEQLSGDSIVSADSVVDVMVAAPNDATDGVLPLVAEMTNGSFTIATAWEHHNVPQFSFSTVRPDQDSLVFGGDSLALTASGLVPGASAQILAGAITLPWVGTAPTADAWGTLRGRVTVPFTIQPGDYSLALVSADRPSVMSSRLLKVRSFLRLEIEDLKQTGYHGDIRPFYAPEFLLPGVSEPWGRKIALRIQGADTTAFGKYSFYYADSGDCRISYFFGRVGSGVIARVKLDSTLVDVPAFDTYFATPGLWRWSRSDTVRGNRWHLGAGWHTVRFEVAGRNASSSGWDLILDQMLIERAVTIPIEPLSVPTVVGFVVPEGIQLCWNRVTVDEAGQPVTPDAYRVYRTTAWDSTATLIATTEGADSSYLDTDPLVGGTLVTYYVTAVIDSTLEKSSPVRGIRTKTVRPLSSPVVVPLRKQVRK